MALQLHASYPEENVLDLLLSVVNLNAQDNSRKNALHSAVEHNNVVVVGKLLKAGVEVEGKPINLNLSAQDNLGKTALHYAVERYKFIGLHGDAGDAA